jgi:hypothetical protein
MKCVTSYRKYDRLNYYEHYGVTISEHILSPGEQNVSFLFNDYYINKKTKPQKEYFDYLDFKCYIKRIRLVQFVRSHKLQFTLSFKYHVFNA